MKKIFLILIICFFTNTIFAQDNNTLTSEEISSQLVEQGLGKASHEDWNGAINEYTNAITKNIKNSSAYYNRAIARNNLKDYRGAITDFSKAIYLNNDDAIVAASYYGRGQCYYTVGNKSNACMDFNKASGLGNQDATAAVQNNCN
jgi:tetratricopeptide (TPR) repeat protein